MVCGSDRNGKPTAWRPRRRAEATEPVSRAIKARRGLAVDSAGLTHSGGRHRPNDYATAFFDDAANQLLKAGEKECAYDGNGNQISETLSVICSSN